MRIMGREIFFFPLPLSILRAMKYSVFNSRIKMSGLNYIKAIVCGALILFFHGRCFSQGEEPLFDEDILPGAYQTSLYFSELEGKKIALVANQSSMINNTHLVDTLIRSGIDLKKIFVPEHGFRGKEDAGAQIKDGKDEKTGLPLLSLHGSNKKPKAEQLKDIDLIIFDLQDVGVRFYTYISTLHYVMEAAAENNIKVMVLDRPNPNGHYVDGPVLINNFTSFVGMHPVPVVYGMTIGEYAQMINGEEWLKGKVKSKLQVIPCQNYDHNKFYKLPIAPSPNLPNMSAIYLYPSLCFFEGTKISVGRGTNLPFQCFGHPDLKAGSFKFVPKPNEGASKPKLQGQECYGFDLSTFGWQYMREQKKLYLFWLIASYELIGEKDFFRNDGFFNLLAGTDVLKKNIVSGKSEKEIRASWQQELQKFKEIRRKYLIYEDFE